MTSYRVEVDIDFEQACSFLASFYRVYGEYRELVETKRYETWDQIWKDLQNK